MKELTIEEKAQRYDEAIERARKIKNGEPINVPNGTSIPIAIFPELKESEDERTWLINYLSNRTLNSSIIAENENLKKAIAWLKKQGEQKPTKTVIEAWKDMRLEVYQQASGNRHEPNYSDDTTKMFSLNDIDEIVEKMSEQSPADKVEQKFHEGDWIIHHGTENIYQVVAIIDNQYQLKYGDNYTVQKCADVDRCARLWNITKDAKPGDVLFTENKNIFIFKSINNFSIYDYCGLYFGKFNKSSASVNGVGAKQFPTNYTPATKEQHDLLFSKMKEAGYEWDAEKKELNKL